MNSRITSCQRHGGTKQLWNGRALAWLFCLAGATCTLAGKVQTWRQATPDDFQGGELTRVVITSEGHVQLSKRWQALANLNAVHVWNTILDTKGNLLVTTGNPGTLTRVNKDGKSEVLFQTEKEQLFALAVAPDGTLFVGASPSGTIWKINPDVKAEEKVNKKPDEKVDAKVPGKTDAKAIEKNAEKPVEKPVEKPAEKPEVKATVKAEKWFTTGESYIWGLALDNKGKLLVATGKNGKLFRVDCANATGQVIFQAKQSHLLSLAAAKDGNIAVGTDKDGLVYRVGADGNAFVIHDADQSDIHSLLLADDGTVFAGTASPARVNLVGGAQGTSFDLTFSGGQRGGMSSGADWSSSGELAFAGELFVLQDKAPPTPPTAPAAPPRKIGTESAPRTTVATSAPLAGENSVLRIRPDGTVDEIFRQKTLILSLLLDQNRLLIGTGQEGRLHEVDLERNLRHEVARLEHGQINSLLRRPDGTIVVGAGTPGKVYHLANQFANHGTLLSKVLDAKRQSRWGRAVSAFSVPQGCKVEIAVRAGNVKIPDDTWSTWVPDTVQLPLGRFFQFRATLSSPKGADTPTLRDFTLFHATVNQAPLVESIEVPDLTKTPLSGPQEKYRLRWKASDPNEDTLTYQLAIRKEGWPAWVTLEKSYTRTEFEWDPGSMPGGLYRARITATDRASNRDQDTLTHEKVSEPFVVDRDAPKVTIEGVRWLGNRLEVKSSASDANSRLTAGDFAIDGKTWTPLYPDDGLFDAPAKQATFVTDALEAGAHVVMVRFRDAAGQLGVADTVVVLEQKAER